MKTKILLSSILLIALTIHLKSQIKVANTTGYVKIGSSANPTKNLDVSGTFIFSPGPSTGSLIGDNTGFYGTVALYPSLNNCGNLGKSNRQFVNIYSWYIYMNNNLVLTSDVKTKENIKNIDVTLHKIMKLRPVMYDIKCNLSDSIPVDQKQDIITKNKNNIGFIAQELMVEFPEVIDFNKESGLYGIKYLEMIPILVKGIQQLQFQIDTLKQLVDKKGSLKSAKSFDASDNTNIEKEASLCQNAPNPFNQNTTIAYYLPETVTKASINIYNMQGNQVKVIPINVVGTGNVIIYGSELQPGMYLYSLIADGKEIDTKRMILTE